MDKNSNAYTFIFAIVLVIVVAAALAFTATSLSEKQAINRKAEKMQDILNTVGVKTVEKDGEEVFLSRDLAEEFYNKYIVEELALKSDGSVDESVNAFEVNLGQELKKPVDKQVFPLYVAEVEGERFYIVPLYGSGLWDAIWGYIGLRDDVNTVVGTNFDHKGETAGLGAEITKDWFEDSFIDEKILDSEGNLVSIDVVKGYTGGNNKDDHAVDGISGSTLTANGVANMLQERLKHYVPYFQENTDVKIQYNAN